MSAMQIAEVPGGQTALARTMEVASVGDMVMSVLRDIRPMQANGLGYDADTNLSDAGFTSIEMVKVMLGVEAAFDLMIPQDMITPEHFASASTIAAMMRKLTGQH